MATKTAENPVHETVEASRHFMQEATTIARQTAERNMTMSRQLADIWAASVEATLKAAFELQNAAMTASRPLFENMGSPNQTAFDQWTDMVHRAQQATMDAWQYGKRFGEQFQPPK
jgi:hypothetical protein